MHFYHVLLSFLITFLFSFSLLFHQFQPPIARGGQIASLLFLPRHQPFLSFLFLFLFFIFYLFLSQYLHYYLGAFLSSVSLNFICVESYRCLVSNGPSLVYFGATVVEISRSEEGDAKLKNSRRFFLEKFITSNTKQVSSSPFGENQLRPCSLRWSNPLIPILAQSIQFIARSYVKNYQCS